MPADEASSNDWRDHGGSAVDTYSYLSFLPEELSCHALSEMNRPSAKGAETACEMNGLTVAPHDTLQHVASRDACSSDPASEVDPGDEALHIAEWQHLLFTGTPALPYEDAGSDMLLGGNRFVDYGDAAASTEASSSSVQDNHVKGNMYSRESSSNLLPKAGTRFTTATLKILKAWLWDHTHHPYPEADELKLLTHQTGLNNQQIATWFANARRRLKARSIVRPVSPSLPHEFGAAPLADTASKPRPIPSFEQMNPLQRWQNSPPEHEAVSVSDILHAVSVSDPTLAPGPERPQDWASNIARSAPDDASSVTTGGPSNSSRSSAGSAYSHASQSSRKSLDPVWRKLKRRRRRVVAKTQAAGGSGGNLRPPSRMYQCTFCTETFTTKHNWQRHEKSLHISLEGWECSPDGPLVPDSDVQMPVCVFCGEIEPDEVHVARHNYDVCKYRDLNERLFYRKDHLQQHLTLVHDAKFRKSTMEHWRRENQLIRSRCGFCNLTMSSWSERTEHIAIHFKSGKSMADWRGGWGFETHVLDMVENSIPPYLIHYERNSPLPFTTRQGPPDTPSNAFELIKTELEYYSSNCTDTNGKAPQAHELQYESCCIIFGSEASLTRNTRKSPAPSWLRDLLMSSEPIAREARLRPLKSAAKSRITQLRIIGKADIFEWCPLEEQLQQHMQISQVLDMAVSDESLRKEACRIVQRMNEGSTRPWKWFTEFLAGLIKDEASSSWLLAFRQRSTAALEGQLQSFTSAVGDDLGHTLDASLPIDPPVSETPEQIQQMHLNFCNSSELAVAPNATAITNASLLQVNTGSGSRAKRTPTSTPPGMVGDDSLYHRLTRELSRYVQRTISDHNPSRHVPTDEELQYQARWIMYDDGDPWNQTPADNADWLHQFKKYNGLYDDVNVLGDDE